MSRANRVVVVVLVVAMSCAAGVAPALARWRLAGVTESSIAYNQGAAFDGMRHEFFFDGVSSLTNSGLYRTDSRLRQTAANTAVLPKTREGYNHAGDLSFDPFRRRILLPLECYYPNSGGNTCGTGAIGVADPSTLRFRYYVNLGRRQIKKAMWDEISPDGRWIWTSSGTHLLAYRESDVTPATARRQRAGRIGGIVGVDLGPVLPASSVTGATFLRDLRTRTWRLLLSLNLGARFEVVSVGIVTSRAGVPKRLTSRPTIVLTIRRSSLNNEPEGLATAPPTSDGGPHGDVLRWQMLPTLTPSTIFTRILTYKP